METVLMIMFMESSVVRSISQHKAVNVLCKKKTIVLSKNQADKNNFRYFHFLKMLSLDFSQFSIASYLRFQFFASCFARKIFIGNKPLSTSSNVTLHPIVVPRLGFQYVPWNWNFLIHIFLEGVHECLVKFDNIDRAIKVVFSTKKRENLIFLFNGTNFL